jgi:GT2 family glycosyltransferase
MKAALVIVSFDSPARLRKHLERLAAQTRKPDSIIVVCTGTIPVGPVLSEFSSSLSLRQISPGNVGPAGGFRAGEELAFSEGYDYVIFADDDALPSDERTLELLLGHADSGVPLAAGYYLDGGPVKVTNHYLMARRDVIARAGFYLRAFFLGFEDIEYAARVGREAPVVRDRAVRIDHHTWWAATDSGRSYYFHRNGLAYEAMKGDLAGFVMLFHQHLQRSLFIAAFLRKTAFLGSFAMAFSDFLRGRLGSREVASVPLPLPEAEAGGAVPLDTDHAGLEHPFGYGDFIPVPSMAPPMTLRKSLGLCLRLRGKDVILTNHSLPSFSLALVFARRVFLFDWKRKKPCLYYRNPVPLSLLAALSLPFLAALSLALAAPAYLLKKGFYRKLLSRSVESDRAFCSGKGSPGRGTPGRSAS